MTLQQLLARSRYVLQDRRVESSGTDVMVQCMCVWAERLQHAMVLSDREDMHGLVVACLHLSTLSNHSPILVLYGLPRPLLQHLYPIVSS